MANSHGKNAPGSGIMSRAPPTVVNGMHVPARIPSEVSPVTCHEARLRRKRALPGALPHNHTYAGWARKVLNSTFFVSEAAL